MGLGADAAAHWVQGPEGCCPDSLRFTHGRSHRFLRVLSCYGGDCGGHMLRQLLSSACLVACCAQEVVRLPEV
jgi:hypothetical protein